MLLHHQAQGHPAKPEVVGLRCLTATLLLPWRRYGRGMWVPGTCPGRQSGAQRTAERRTAKVRSQLRQPLPQRADVEALLHLTRQIRQGGDAFSQGLGQTGLAVQQVGVKTVIGV